MNSEERFKKSLDELLGSKEFSFDEANWEKAREMIDASKKAKKRRALPFILSGALLLISVLTGLYLLSSQSTVPDEFVVNPAKVVSPAAGTTIVQENLKLKALPKPTNTTKKTIDDKQYRIGKDNSLTERSSTMTNSPQKNTLPFSTKENAPVTVFVPSNNPLSNNHNEEKSQVPISSTITSPLSANANAAVNNPSQASGSDIGNTNEESSATLNTSPTQVAETAITGKESSAEIKKNDADPTPISALINPTLSAANEEPLAPEKLAETPSVAASNPSIAVSTVVKDLTDSVLLSNDLGEIGKPKEFPVLFSVEAGTSYLLGWKNPGSRDAKGFNPLIGVNYFTGVNSKLSLSLGLHYTSVNHLNYSKYTSKITRLNLGEESDVTIFTPVKVHYLIVPLRLNYNMTPKNTIGIGCNVAYLLNVESEVESYTEKLNTTSNYSISKTSGYTEGFKKYDTQVSVFYRRRLYPNLSVNTELFYGLTDIKDNRFFNSNVMERNTGIKLTLVYNILKK